MATQTIRIGTAGSIDVDTDRLPEAAKAHIFAYGLKQILNDARSALTNKSGAAPDAVMAAVQKKLDALYTGTVRAERAGAFVAREPVIAETLRLARAVMKLAGDKKPTAEAVKAYADTYPELGERAQRNVDEARSLAGIATAPTKPSAKPSTGRRAA
jgi:hypothetical protein